MWRVTIKGLLAHKLRLALTALAIVLGVTFIAGTFVLTDTLHSTFDTLFGNIYQNVDFQVRGVAQFGSGGTATRNPVPESLLAKVRDVPGVEAADGSVTGFAQFIAPDGKAISNGGAPGTRRLLRPRPADLGPAHRAGRAADDLERRRHGSRHGAEVRLQGGPAGAHPAAGADQDVHHHGPGDLRHGRQPGRRHAGRLRHPDRPGAPGRGRSVRRHQRRRRNPAPTRRPSSGTSRGCCRPASRWSPARPSSTRRPGPSASALGFFNTALLVFGFIALFVGGFTILNTFSITVGQRTRELALLRIVGASRRQVFRSVLGRGGHRRAGVVADRPGTGRAGGHRAREAVERLRSHAAVGPARVRGAHRHRLHHRRASA